MPIKVAIVEDDEGIRSSLGALIRRAPALRLAGDYPDAESAIREIPRRSPDVVLMDINLPGLNGVECVRQLKSSLPAVQFLMLTVYEDGDSLFNSLKAGASGYLLKRTASARLLEAIAPAEATYPASSAAAQRPLNDALTPSWAFADPTTVNSPAASDCRRPFARDAVFP